MDKVNFIRNGVSRLPPGFRFQPTDEELVFQYLKCKIFSSPLPASVIPDLINVSKYDPWDLPPPPAGSCNEQQETYFFSCKEAKYRNSNRMKRTTKCGYWKATGSDKKISSPTTCTNGLVGLRKTLVFYQGKSPNGTKTDWVLHEYRLVSTIDQPTPNCNSTHQQNYLINEIGDWVLCRLSMKKRSLESDGSTTRGGHRQNNSRLFDFMMVSNSNNRSSTSSSCSSSSNNNNNNIEVSSNAQQDHHDETSTGGYICSPF